MRARRGDGGGARGRLRAAPGPACGRQWAPQINDLCRRSQDRGPRGRRRGWRAADGGGTVPRGIAGPRGLAAKVVSVDLHAVTADDAPLRNLVHVAERAYLSVT